MNNKTQPIRIPTQPCPIQHQETQTMINPYVRYMDNAENELQKAPAKHDALAVLCLAVGYSEPGLASLAVVLAALSSGGSVAFARFLERWL